MPFGIRVSPQDDLDYRKRRTLGAPLEDIKDLYEDQGPALGAYKEHLSGIPQREDYGNSTGRKLLAGVVGGLQALREGPGAGIRTTTGILEDRYGNALQDYKNKASGLKEQAELEQAQTNSKIKYLIDSEDLIRKDREVDIKDRNVDSQDLYRRGQVTNSGRVAGAAEQRAVDYGRSVGNQRDVGMARVAASNRMAGAAERNASTNEGRERRLKDAPPKIKGPTSFQFKDAGNQALLDVVQERPEFQEFVGEKGVITPPEDPAKMEAFQLFRQLLEAKKRKRLGQGGDFALDVQDPDDDEDDEIIEP